MCIHFGAVKVIHLKNSDKHESSLTLRVTLNKSWHRLINTLVVNKLMKPFFLQSKIALNQILTLNIGVTPVLTVTQVYVLVNTRERLPSPP